MRKLSNEIKYLYCVDSVSAAINLIFNFIYRLDYRLTCEGVFFCDQQTTLVNGVYVELSKGLKKEVRRGLEFQLHNFISSLLCSGQNIVFDILLPNGTACGKCVIEYDSPSFILVKIHIQHNFLFNLRFDYASPGFDGDLVVAQITICDGGMSSGLFMKQIQNFLGCNLTDFIKRLDHDRAKLDFYTAKMSEWTRYSERSPIEFDVVDSDISLLFCNPEGGFGRLTLLARDHYKLTYSFHEANPVAVQGPPQCDVVIGTECV